MFTKKKSYKSKLLLFGEHILIKGAQALAVPFSVYKGSWKYTTSEKRGKKQMQLPDLASWLLNKQNQGQLMLKLDIRKFNQALNQGLYFESNIPLGYGVGSSGALCAGIYDQFGLEKKKDFVGIRQDLAAIESFFHGSSSGIDPLVAYVEKAVLIKSKTDIQELPLSSFDIDQGRLFILDTKIQRETQPFVNLFLERCEDRYYYDRIISELIPHNDDAIHAFINKNWPLLWDLVHEISFFQFKYFDPMIPKAFRSIWLDGLSGDLYKLKLCGAGGGGFILGFTPNFEKTKAQLSQWKLQAI